MLLEAAQKRPTLGFSMKSTVRINSGRLMDDPDRTSLFRSEKVVDVATSPKQDGTQTMRLYLPLIVKKYSHGQKF